MAQDAVSWKEAHTPYPRRRPVSITIHFTPSTVKTLADHFQAALRRGDPRLVKRIAGLLFLADGLPVAQAARRVGVSEATLYHWLAAFVQQRFASLHYRKPPGRPAKLTPTQKQRLCALVEAGPEAAGYRTGCWNCALLQGLILREFGVLYNPHYLAELLRNLGFSYQKARFVSDHLNEAKRQEWLQATWPTLLAAARR